MAGKSKKVIKPVKPQGMEIVLFYPCPYCDRQVPLISPTQPSVAQCDSCGSQFPIVPADAKSIQFIKLMMDQGRASIDPDFL